MGEGAPSALFAVLGGLMAAAVICMACRAGLAPVELRLPSTSHYEQEMRWGSYRPNVYFGMAMKEEEKVLTGLMWGSGMGVDQMRHTCDHGDRLQRFGWKAHDGRSFGEHEVEDQLHGMRVVASFAKVEARHSTGGSWANRVTASRIPSVAAVDPPSVVFAYYITLPSGCSGSLREVSRAGVSSVLLEGHCASLGEFSFIVRERDLTDPQEIVSHPTNIRYPTEPPDLSKFHYVGMRVEEGTQWKFFEKVKELLRGSLQEQFSIFNEEEQRQGRVVMRNNIPQMHGTLPNRQERGSNCFAFQLVRRGGFDVDVAFVAHAAHTEGGGRLSPGRLEQVLQGMTGEALSDLLGERKAAFDKRFQETFSIDESLGDKQQLEATGAFALSNMLGGIGHWSGHSLLYEGKEKEPSLLPATQLFSAVPSRAFFPRGFLWDEGFHQLLIGEWDTELSMDIIGHWLNLLTSDGWLPREQILGDEARSRVPHQFIPQHRDHANPPAFFLALEKMLSKAEAQALSDDGTTTELYRDFFESIFPRLEHWRKWYIKSQAGIKEDSFRWRGRAENHTLSSGLDDYPRGRFPSDHELHLDLACWMIMSARVSGRIATFLGRSSDATRLELEHQRYLAALEVHWDERRQLYGDIEHWSPEAVQYTSHIGYVTLFPLGMGLYPKDSPRLLRVLEVLLDDKLLWSPYGLRSLSLSDPLAGTGEDYWKGNIWININYLVVSSLHKHYVHDGPYAGLAREIYTQLRAALLGTISSSFASSGFIWEQYSPFTGRGMRTHPFTGWSALVVNMMAERY